MWDRIGLTEGLLPGKAKPMRRFINNFDELTSRLRSSDVPAILQKLFTEKPDKEAVDLCYATNMIQVGLDVPRLSLMSIVRQPKGASEYIQASSRVGRGSGRPGLVVTNYNPFKPRDRSHFESFRSFHENAYRLRRADKRHAVCHPGLRTRHTCVGGGCRAISIPRTQEHPSRVLRPSAQNSSESSWIGCSRSRRTRKMRAKAILDRFLDDWERRRPHSTGT